MKLLETVKFWWRVKQYNRRLLKQAKTADKTPYATTAEDVDEWFKKNPFKLTRENLDSHCMESAPESRAVNTFKEINYGN
jgi:hypothetical protein